MKTTKKKPSIPLIIIGALLAAYAGYLLNGAWHQGIEFGDFVNNMTQVLSYPLRDYYNESTLKAVIIFEIIFAMVIVPFKNLSSSSYTRTPIVSTCTPNDLTPCNFCLSMLQ